MAAKYILVLALLTSLAGCGTIIALPSDSAHAGQRLAKLKSHCDAVPRVCGGVMLDFCTLNAEPPTLDASYQPSPTWVVVDIALSGVADTVALPYTIYLQNEYGSIQKSRFE